MESASGSVNTPKKKQGVGDEQSVFDGLSYPANVLDWCLTRSDCTMDTEPVIYLKHVCNFETDVHMKRVSRTFVDTFRMRSPYIHAHQGLLFVIPIPAALLQEN